MLFLKCILARKTMFDFTFFLWFVWFTEPKGKPTEAMRGGRYCLCLRGFIFFCSYYRLLVSYCWGWAYCGLDHGSWSVKQVSFYDDDARFWQLWCNRSAAAEAPSAVHQHSSAFSSPISSTRGRHFLVICCENKAIFLDLVTMRGRDVPKQDLDNKSLLWQVLLAAYNIFSLKLGSTYFQQKRKRKKLYNYMRKGCFNTMHEMFYALDSNVQKWKSANVLWHIEEMSYLLTCVILQNCRFI